MKHYASPKPYLDYKPPKPQTYIRSVGIPINLMCYSNGDENSVPYSYHLGKKPNPDYQYRTLTFNEVRDNDLIEVDNNRSKIKRMAIKGPQMIIQLETDKILTGLLTDTICVYRPVDIPVNESKAAAKYHAKIVNSSDNGVLHTEDFPNHLHDKFK